MDMTWVRGLVLILMIVAFMCMWIWAWSKKRKPVFDEAARLPLEEDAVRADARTEKEE